MPQWRPIMLLALLSVVAACAHKTPPGYSNTFTPISGKARVLSIDHALGIGTLEIDGKAVNFWWRSKSRRASQGDALAGWENNPLALEDSELEIPLSANPGDLIYFRGYRRHGEILLISAAAIKQ